MGVLSGLQPERVFYYFEEISRIPRCSGNRGGIADYLEEFARAHQLRCVRDEADNIVIFKRASAGYEAAPTVILQGHCDMVGVKKPFSEHNFMTDPLQLEVKGDRISAKDTSLGADDGIGVAYCLAVLESEELLHPALEVVLTSDEEVGLEGAARLDTSCLSGRYLLNLDYSTEGTLLAGCAGGVNVSVEYYPEAVTMRGTMLTVRITGLRGGHSGIQIGTLHANACVQAVRLLQMVSEKLEVGLLRLDAGVRPNVIPDCAEITMVIPQGRESEVRELLPGFCEALREKYAEENAEVSMESEQGESATPQEYSVIAPADLKKTAAFLLEAPDGVQKMSEAQPGCVETSANLGVVQLNPQKCTVDFGIRSSVDCAKMAVADRIEGLAEELGGSCGRSGEYPAWEYLENSVLRKQMVKSYKELFGTEPGIEIVHAGLECGFFSSKIPGLDCVSFAPDMFGIHTAEEELGISSTERMWRYLKKILEAFGENESGFFA